MNGQGARDVLEYFVHGQHPTRLMEACGDPRDWFKHRHWLERG